MRLRSLCIALFLLLLALPVAAADPPKPDSGVPVDLEADHLDFDESSGRYHALGNVHLSQGPLQLTSDELWWNQQTGEVVASGEVRLVGPGEELSGEKITYNLQQGTGIVENGEAYWEAESLRLTGRRIERLGPNKFRVHDGRFTVCEGERPAWSIGSSQADVTIGGYLKAKHALIYIKDVPSFYLPYFMVSVKTERESGFLLPHLGYSDRRGTELSTAWYQVLGRNMDATFFLDHLSEIGTGTGFEYRYIFGQKHRGKLYAYTVFAEDDINRWAFDWQHFSQLSDSMRLVVDAEHVNERDYFSDFGEVSEEYNKQKVISSAFLNQAWTKASLTGQLKYIKDLETEDPLPWQAGPHVDFSVVPLRVKQTPFYLGLQSSYINFIRDHDVIGQRLMARPTLGLHAYLFKGLEFDSEYGYRHRQYADVDDSLTDSSGSADYRARLSSRISKVFGDDRHRWQHSVEPEIVYSYIEGNLGGDLPDFDLYDQVEHLNSLGYALINRINGKWIDAEGSEVQREVVWLKFSQGYDLRRKQEEGSAFSDLRTELILRPTRYSSLALDSLYDVDLGRIPDFSLTGDVHDGKGNHLAVTYRKRRPASGLDKVDNINFSIDTSLLKPLYLRYEQRYDFLESNLLEQVLGLDYRQQCWGLGVVMRDREEDRSIMFTLSLSGLGEIGTVGKTYD